MPQGRQVLLVPPPRKDHHTSTATMTKMKMKIKGYWVASQPHSARSADMTHAIKTITRRRLSRSSRETMLARIDSLKRTRRILRVPWRRMNAWKWRRRTMKNKAMSMVMTMIVFLMRMLRLNCNIYQAPVTTQTIAPKLMELISTLTRNVRLMKTMTRVNQATNLQYFSHRGAREARHCRLERES